VSERGTMLEYEHPTTLVGVGTEVLCHSFFILSLSLYYYYILIFELLGLGLFGLIGI